MTSKKMTKGEFRGAVALAAVLLIVLALTAVSRCGNGGSSEARYSEPARAMHAADSLATAAQPVDSTEVNVTVRGAKPAAAKQRRGLKKGARKKRAAVADRPSPHEDVNS